MGMAMAMGSGERDHVGLNRLTHLFMGPTVSGKRMRTREGTVVIGVHNALQSHDLRTSVGKCRKILLEIDCVNQKKIFFNIGLIILLIKLCKLCL